jgi:hypothetical protein
MSIHFPRAYDKEACRKYLKNSQNVVNKQGPDCYTGTKTVKTPCTVVADLFSILKGIVQRDLTGVKTRLKRSVMVNYIGANFAF